MADATPTAKKNSNPKYTGTIQTGNKEEGYEKLGKVSLWMPDADVQKAAGAPVLKGTIQMNESGKKYSIALWNFKPKAKEGTQATLD